MENKSNILVIGGTGKTGRKVASKLTEAGHHVRIGSRSANPSFDWENPETWLKAMTGMDKVYITFQPDLAVPDTILSSLLILMLFYQNHLNYILFDLALYYN